MKNEKERRIACSNVYLRVLCCELNGLHEMTREFPCDPSVVNDVLISTHIRAGKRATLGDRAEVVAVAGKMRCFDDRRWFASVAR